MTKKQELIGLHMGLGNLAVGAETTEIHKPTLKDVLQAHLLLHIYIVHADRKECGMK